LAIGAGGVGGEGGPASLAASLSRTTLYAGDPVVEGGVERWMRLIILAFGGDAGE
jgi:hypothetical protein